MGIKLKKNLKEFESIIKVINKVSDETDYIFTPEGIRISAVDPSSTYIAIFKIDKSMFEEYEIENEITYLIDIEKFVNIMNIVADKEMKIEITEKGLIIKQGRKKFKLSYFDGINDDKNKWRCYTDVAGKIGDETICDKISTTEGKEDCYYGIALNKDDFSFCQKIENNRTDRNKCLLAVAERVNDQTICKKIDAGAPQKEWCYNNF